MSHVFEKKVQHLQTIMHKCGSFETEIAVSSCVTVDSNKLGTDSNWFGVLPFPFAMCLHCNYVSWHWPKEKHPQFRT